MLMLGQECPEHPGPQADLSLHYTACELLREGGCAFQLQSQSLANSRQ